MTSGGYHFTLFFGGSTDNILCILTMALFRERASCCSINSTHVNPALSVPTYSVLLHYRLLHLHFITALVSSTLLPTYAAICNNSADPFCGSAFHKAEIRIPQEHGSCQSRDVRAGGTAGVAA